MMRRNNQIFTILPFVLSIFSLCITNNIHAGRLDSFEQSVKPDKNNKNNKNNKTSNSSQSHDINSDDCEEGNHPINCIGYFIFKALGEAMLFGGYNSLARVNPQTNIAFNADFSNIKTSNKSDENPDEYSIDDKKLSLRVPHEPHVPFIRIDSSYQIINSNINSKDYRLTLGYGPIAVQYNQTRYSESKPIESLNLYRLYLSYQMSFGSHFQMDIGLGTLDINGNRKTRLSYLTVPIRLHFPRSLGIEYKPAWAGNISDYDLGLFYHFKYASIKTGYRWLSTNSESLNGPYMGLTFFY